MALRYSTVTCDSLPSCPEVVRQKEVYLHILKMKHVTRPRSVSRLATFLFSPILSKLLFLLQSDGEYLPVGTHGKFSAQLDPMSGIESPTEDLQRRSLFTAASLFKGSSIFRTLGSS